MIGAKPPENSRIWRNSAETLGVPKQSYARGAALCDALSVRAVPQSKSVCMYHFRTPSPGGQQAFSKTLLPAFFCAGTPADICPTRQFGAHLTSRASSRLTFAPLCLSTRKTSKGKRPWALNLSRLHALRHWALPPAVTPWANRPSSAVRSARVRRLLPAAASQPASRLAQQATFWRASSTSPTADARALQQTTSQERRRALWHGGVLHFLPNSSEGPCSKSF